MRKIHSALIAGMLSAGMIAAPPTAFAKGGPPPVTAAGPVPPASITKDGTLVETGSGNLYSLMNIWANRYQKLHTDIKISTKNLGSEAGILQVADGKAHIGASEAYMTDAQIAEGKLLNIPLAVGAEQIVYNIPEIGTEHLHLSGSALIGIYNGTLRYWDDSKIRQLNPNLAKRLPHQRIIPIHGGDGSGDTFVFTQFLSSADSSWKAGYGTTITWPSVLGAISGDDNQAVLGVCQGREYSIGYVSLQVVEQVTQDGLGVAALQNQNGRFVLPNAKTIAAAAATFDHETPADERVSLLMAPGDTSYPIVTYEYAIVNPNQPDDATAAAVKNFLSWAIAGNGGSDTQFLNTHFAPLPASVAKISQAQIDAIQSIQ